jgi:hypothetical protein
MAWWLVKQRISLMAGCLVKYRDIFTFTIFKNNLSQRKRSQGIDQCGHVDNLCYYYYGVTGKVAPVLTP